MTDLEMVRKCAEAMGLAIDANADTLWLAGTAIPRYTEYDPLLDDAQAMELVKRFPEQCLMAMAQASADSRITNALSGISASTPDLNRAIVSCVAKMNGSGE